MVLKGVKMEVLGLSKHKVAWCDKCRSVLELSRAEDVKSGEKDYITYDYMSAKRTFYYVECPVCGNRIEVF